MPLRRARGAAIDQFFDRLSEGDPVAVAMAVGFAVLVAIAAGIAIYDRKQRKKEARKTSGQGAGRRP
jgi:hypothetical protein